jgi:hypothetical protein
MSKQKIYSDLYLQFNVMYQAIPTTGRYLRDLDEDDSPFIDP